MFEFVLKCMCWREKCTNSAVNKLFSLLVFMTSQRKVYLIGICSTVHKGSKRDLEQTNEDYLADRQIDRQRKEKQTGNLKVLTIKWPDKMPLPKM